MTQDEPAVPPIVFSGAAAAAKAVGISRAALYIELKAGRIVGRKYGRRTLFERAEIERFIRSLPTTH